MPRRVFLQLSDIHFTASDGGLARRNQSLRIDIENDIEQMRQRVGDATAVLVTGDIAYSGKEAEYRRARDWLETVCAKAGALRTSVLCVPGNHDIDRDTIRGSLQTVIDRLRTCPESEIDGLLDEYMAEEPAPILRGLAEYNTFAARYDCSVDGRSYAYWQAPSLDVGRGYELTIRGITTVLSSDRADARAKMVVGATQTLLQQDNPARVYMVLAHHPPDWWRDHDRANGNLRHRAHIKLWGHKHRQTIDIGVDAVSLTAGAVHPEEDSGWLPRYNWLVVDVSAEDPPRLCLQLWPRVWDANENRFVAEAHDGHDYREVFLQLVPCSPVINYANAEPEVASPEEEPVPPDSVRPPLLTSHNSPDPERDIVGAFLDLSFADQIAVLVDLGLIEEDDRDRPFVRTAFAAIRRVRQDGRDEQLWNAIAAHGGRKGERT